MLLINCLYRLIQAVQPLFSPKYLLSDMERAYDLALQKVWPETAHIICWFHLQQALITWYVCDLCMCSGVCGFLSWYSKILIHIFVYKGLFYLFTYL